MVDKYQWYTYTLRITWYTHSLIAKCLIIMKMFLDIYYINELYISMMLKHTLPMFNIWVNVNYLISMMTTRMKPAILAWYKLVSCWWTVKTVSFIFFHLHWYTLKNVSYSINKYLKLFHWFVWFYKHQFLFFNFVFVKYIFEFDADKLRLIQSNKFKKTCVSRSLKFKIYRTYSCIHFCLYSVYFRWTTVNVKSKNRRKNALTRSYKHKDTSPYIINISDSKTIYISIDRTIWLLESNSLHFTWLIRC